MQYRGRVAHGHFEPEDGDDFPFFRARTPEAIEAEKRQFYVGVTRARKLLMYVAKQDRFGNPPSMFLGPAGVNIVS